MAWRSRSVTSGVPHTSDVAEDIEAVLVRRAGPHDHSALQGIYRTASLGNAGDRDALLAHPEVLTLPDDLISHGRTWVAATADGTVVGFASTSPKGDGVLELDDLFVEPRFQRRGTARMLVARILAEAAGEQVTRLEVTANDHALGFYRGLGFKEDGRVHTQFGVGTRMHVPLPEHPGGTL